MCVIQCAAYTFSGNVAFLKLRYNIFAIKYISFSFIRKCVYCREVYLDTYS